MNVDFLSNISYYSHLFVKCDLQGKLICFSLITNYQQLYFQEIEVEIMLSILLLITAWAFYKVLKCQKVKMLLTAKPQRIRGGHGTSLKLVQKAKDLNLN